MHYPGPEGIIPRQVPGKSEHRDFPGWESLADVIAHFRFVRNHHRLIKRVVLVTDAEIAEIFPVIVDHFVKAEVKHFDFDDFDEAVTWIS